MELYLMKETNLTLKEIHSLPKNKIEAYIIMLNEKHKYEEEMMRKQNARKR